MMGVILVSVAFLFLLNLADVGVFTDETLFLLLMAMFLLIGILDIAAGIIFLWR